MAMTISDILAARQAGRKFAAISCYDFTMARLVAAAGVEMILVGDSAAQLVLGHDSTLAADMDFMVKITAGVRRAAPEVCLVADMPFLSYQPSIPEAVRNAGRFLTEAGANIVKIEASAAYLPVIKAVSDAEIPVMAHIGIRPQSIVKRGKLKAEGTTAELAFELISLADKMIQAGASSLLLEGTAREVAAIVTRRVDVPVISCGSGPDCDGQILILADILGLTSGKGPKFVRRFAELGDKVTESVTQFADEVRRGQFPTDELCYHIKAGQLEALEQMLQDMR